MPDSSDAPLAEPTAIPNTFVNGLAPIEDRGEYVRLTWYVDGAEGPEVAVRLVMTRGAYESARDILATGALRLSS